MSTVDLKSALADAMRGEMADDAETLTKMSRDTSLFTRMPSVVVYPVDSNDVSEIVRVVGAERKRGAEVSLVARAAGTDMSGGPLTTSVVVSFTEHMNRMGDVNVGRTTSYIDG